MSRCRAFAFMVAGAWGLAWAAGAHARPAQPAVGGEPDPGYHLVKSVALGAPDQWDYVIRDPASDRIFAAHGNRLTVIDGSSGRIVGQVGPIPGGPHGTAFDTAAGIGITDDGRLGQAVLFNPKTLAVIRRVKVQRGADAVTFDPVSGHAFVIDGDTGDIAVVDPLHGRLVRLIRIGGDLEYAVPGGNGELYVNAVTRREIIRINTASNHVDATWPIRQCDSPHGLAIDTQTHRLFASCENQRLVVVNSEDGALIASVPIGRGTDGDRFDPKSRLIFSSNGVDGTLSIIREVDAEHFVPVATVPTALSARTMEIDPQTGRVYLLAAQTSREAMAHFMAQWRKTHRRPRHSPFAPGSLRLLILAPGR